MLSGGSTQCWTEKRDTMPDVGRTQCWKGKQDTIPAVEGTQGLLWEGQTMLDRRGTQCVIERGHNAGDRWETKMSEQHHTTRPFARDGNSDHTGRYYLEICTDGVELSGMTTSNFQIIPETSRSFRSMMQLHSSELNRGCFCAWFNVSEFFKRRYSYCYASGLGLFLCLV